MPIDPFRGPPVLSEPVRQLIGQIPYVGMAYNGGRVVNQLVKWIQQMTGNLPANQALNGNDPDYNNSNYIGLGDPAGTPVPTDTSSPTPPSFGPDSSTSRAAWDRASGAAPGVRPNVGGNTMGNYASINYWANNQPGSAFNRFTVGRAYSPTANVAGSSDYVPFSKLISHGGIDGGTSAFEQYVLSRTQL